MIQEIIQKAEAIIHKQMMDKFGLSSEESERTADAFREVLHNFFRFDLLNDPNLLQSTLEQVKSLQDKEGIARLRTNLVEALEKKVGLSPELAASVRDFSMTAFFETIRQEITDQNGQIDIQKVLSKINLNDLENSARDLFNTIGQRFIQK